MRFARKPQAACGERRTAIQRESVTGIGSALARALLLVFCVLPLLSAPASAQDPSRSVSRSASGGSSFAKPEGGIFGGASINNVDQALPLYLQGDELIYDTKGNRVIAKGNVQIFHDNNLLRADEVVYDQGAGTLTAVGNVELKEKNGNIIRAERYTLTDDFRDGFVQSLRVSTSDDSTITAERAERREGNVTEFTNARFTPCKSSNGIPPLWCLSANKIVHDQAATQIYYQDAFFELYGVPVLYMPYFSHPDPTVKRRSGFLAPEYAASGDLGYMAEIPYYFALAPNYDFLFHPMYLSKQGVLWQGDWRHRLEDGEYTVKVQGIDQDSNDLPLPDHGFNNSRKPEDREAKRDALDGWRGSLETKGEFSLSSWWKYGWDVTIESDDSFRRFYKLDNVLITDRVNRGYAIGQSDRNYLGATVYQFGGLLADDSATTESWVHPIIDYNYVFRDPVLGGELRWDSNALSFSRSELSNDPLDPDARDREDINRAVTELKWRRRLTDTIGITYTPFAEVRGDVYQLSNFEDPDSCVPKYHPTNGRLIGATCDIIEEKTEVRGRATGGITVAYPWAAYTAGGSHVVEPIGQIVAHTGNADDQRHLPDEDAKSLVFDDSNLFETDKFSGFDRLETGTRVNAGVQYTFQANSGGYVRLLAGQSFHVAGDNAFDDPGRDSKGYYVHAPTSGLQSAASDYVLGAYIAPTDYFRLVSQSRFNEDGLGILREDASMSFQYGPMKLSAIYSFTAADPERDVKTDLQDVSGALALQLSDRWSLLGSIRYDLEGDEIRTDAIQLRYLDECFMLSATYQETYITNTEYDLEPDTTIMLRFELKHLGGFKYKNDMLDHLSGDAQAKP